MQNLNIPLRFHPVYQTYLWGGGKLRDVLGRTDTPDGIVAESWEVTDRPDGMSVVAKGPLAGKTLRELIELDPQALLGPVANAECFPLLIKVLDAARTLSVQVHPNDETAARYGGEAKTETWYILEADPEACVYCGFKETVSAEQFQEAILQNRLEPLLKKIPVKAGDAIFVPGGQVHAIASGCLLLEVQQNSNTTYRIYDWGRVDAKGRGRELHIDQALQVSCLEAESGSLQAAEEMPPLNGLPRERVVQSPYFLLERLTLADSATLPGGQGFQILFALDAPFSVSAGGERVAVPRGSSVLLPAAAEEAVLEGTARVMRITAP